MLHVQCCMDSSTAEREQYLLGARVGDELEAVGAGWAGVPGHVRSRAVVQHVQNRHERDALPSHATCTAQATLHLTLSPVLDSMGCARAACHECNIPAVGVTQVLDIEGS